MLTGHWRCARTLIRLRSPPAPPTVPYPHRSDLDLSESKWVEDVGLQYQIHIQIRLWPTPVVYPVLLDQINLIRTFSGIDLGIDLFCFLFSCVLMVQ